MQINNKRFYALCEKWTHGKGRDIEPFKTYHKWWSLVNVKRVSKGKRK